MTSSFDVFDYGPRLTWVARLYDGSGVEVASAKAQSKTVAAPPPDLKPVGKRVWGRGPAAAGFSRSHHSPRWAGFNTNLDDFPDEATLTELAGAGFTSGFEVFPRPERVTRPGDGRHPDATFTSTSEV